MNKERIKEILGLPDEAKIKGIVYRRVKKQSEKKYPAVVYKLEGKQHIKHINKFLREKLGLAEVSNQLDTQSPKRLDMVSNHGGKVSNRVSNQLDTKESNRYLTDNLTPKQLLQKLTDELDTLTDEELEEMVEGLKFFLFKYLDRRDWNFSDLTFYILKDADKKRVMEAFRGMLVSLAVQIERGKLGRSNLFEIKKSIQLFWGILKKAFKKENETSN